jgi:hypothetical protein
MGLQEQGRGPARLQQGSRASGAARVVGRLAQRGTGQGGYSQCHNRKLLTLLSSCRLSASCYAAPPHPDVQPSMSLQHACTGRPRASQVPNGSGPMERSLTRYLCDCRTPTGGRKHDAARSPTLLLRSYTLLTWPARTSFATSCAGKGRACRSPPKPAALD